jgi:hypothetical protein
VEKKRAKPDRPSRTSECLHPTLPHRPPSLVCRQSG